MALSNGQWDCCSIPQTSCRVRPHAVSHGYYRANAGIRLQKGFVSPTMNGSEYDFQQYNGIGGAVCGSLSPRCP
jgi:hypothetical protein